MPGLRVEATRAEARRLIRKFRMNKTTMDLFSPFSSATWHVLAFLTIGLQGSPSVTITASTRGLTLKLGGLVVARGKDPKELINNYEAARARNKV